MKPNVSKNLRTLAFGLVAGLTAVTLRAPRGLSLVQTVAVEPEVAAVVRGAALCTIALAFLAARSALSAPPSIVLALFGALVGFALGGLVLDPWLEPQGTLGLVVRGAIGAALLFALAGPFANRDTLLRESERPSLLESAGIALAGFGLALALDGVARWVRIFGHDRPVDDAVHGATFLCATAIGALCFRDLVRGLVRRLGRTESRAPLATGAALAAAAAVPSIWFLAEITARHRLDSYAGSFGLKLIDHGSLAFTALVGARAFALPGLFLGAAATAALQRTELASLLLGAALGTVLAPSVWALLIERATSDAAIATTLASTGACVALFGAFATTLGQHLRPARVRLAVLIPALVVIAVVVFVPRPSSLPLSPWTQFEPRPLLVQQDPAGFVTVESAPGFSTTVTLDRRRVTPIAEERAADELRLELSLGLLPPDSGAPSVLLIGQLTPSRWWALRRLGVTTVDRSAAWWRSMAAIEAELFAEHGHPPGDVLPPTLAEERCERGEYDLVVVPPTEGLAPLVPALDLPEPTILVVWLDAREHAAQRAWGSAVLWASEGLLEPAVGVVSGPWSAARPAAFGPAWRADGAGAEAEAAGGVFEARNAPLALWPVGGAQRRPIGLTRMNRIDFLRRRDSSVACAERLVAEAELAPRQTIAETLRALFAAQQRSFWQTRLADVELDFDALTQLRDATLAVELLDASLAAVWEGLADTFVEQREIQAIQELLGPLAEARSPWPRLEFALAHSDLEFNDPGDAARRLVLLARHQPGDAELRLQAAHALSQAGDHVAAAKQLREADGLQPGRRDVRRALAMAMVRGGEAGGRSLVRELLDEDPADEELEPFLGAGPFPPVPQRFLAEDGHEGHDHAGHLHEAPVEEGPAQADPEHEGHEGHDHGG